jgi:type III restriction enzyme
MKIKFDSTLLYQSKAIQSVIGLFNGQHLAESTYSVSLTNIEFMGTTQNELGLGNKFSLSSPQIDSWLLKNTRKIQEDNQIPMVANLNGRHFSIEMETGTGKTYVYLRSIFELNKVYGFKKFVIVVPSIAIREGVISSIKSMTDHFTALYGQPFDSILYDSRDLGKVRSFATSNTIQIMVINIQAFQRAENIMNQKSDRLSWHEPIEFIKAAQPIVIVDEPQNMEAEASREAITKLNPLCTLRYSATHKNAYNLLYKLDPIKAYDLRLVKRIEVASVVADENINDAFIELKKLDNKKTLKAQIRVNVASGTSVDQRNIWVKRGDDLFFKTNERQEYKDGFIVEGISLASGDEFIKFTNGVIIKKGEAIGNFKEDVMKAQILETVKQHFEKVKNLKGRGIKVLSLFFIDAVSDYRIYNPNGSISLGPVGIWFEEAYKKLQSNNLYKDLIPTSSDVVHGGYFSKDKKGRFKDSNEGGGVDDIDTYSAIMREKETLLSFDYPLQFIFSHSALREGWDNPNVFQICTLRKTGSIKERRQTIGRGLRLPVDQNGERVHDESINRLTIIANESYDNFARELQTEYETDYGIQFSTVPVTAFSKLVIESDSKPTEIKEQGSIEIWKKLVDKLYLTAEGKITDKFDIKKPDFQLDVPDQYISLRAKITDIVNQYVFKNRVVNSRDRATIRFNKKVQLNPEFKAMWDEISQKTRYRVNFQSENLIQLAVNRFKANLRDNGGKIQPLQIQIDVTGIDPTLGGVIFGAIREQSSINVSSPKQLPDILSYLQNETELTRHTLVEILIRSGRLDEFVSNPQTFIFMAAKEINKALHDLMLEGIEYKKISGKWWEMRRLEEDAEQGIVRYLNNLYPVQNQDKTVYDYIEFQSKVEQDFARDLDANQRIKFFIKLPNWFKIDTPIGPYNPDWAFVLNDTDKIYFIRETKSTLESDERKKSENAKIDCARKHFEALNASGSQINFSVTTSLKETLTKI